VLYADAFFIHPTIQIIMTISLTYALCTPGTRDLPDNILVASDTAEATQTVQKLPLSKLHMAENMLP
jgi:hypothetical protein